MSLDAYCMLNSSTSASLPTTRVPSPTRRPEAARPSATGTSTFSRFTPRVGINYHLSPEYGLYVSYAQGFRAPAFLELTCAGPGAICPGLQAGVAPDPPLKSVRAAQYEIGFQ